MLTSTNSVSKLFCYNMISYSQGRRFRRLRLFQSFQVVYNTEEPINKHIIITVIIAGSDTYLTSWKGEQQTFSNKLCHSGMASAHSIMGGNTDLLGIITYQSQRIMFLLYINLMLLFYFFLLILPCCIASWKPRNIHNPNLLFFHATFFFKCFCFTRQKISLHLLPFLAWITCNSM